MIQYNTNNGPVLKVVNVIREDSTGRRRRSGSEEGKIVLEIADEPVASTPVRTLPPEVDDDVFDMTQKLSEELRILDNPCLLHDAEILNLVAAQSVSLCETFPLLPVPGLPTGSKEQVTIARKFVVCV